MLLRSTKTHGLAANSNHGAPQARNVQLVFTDDYCLPKPGWIESFARITAHYDVMEGRTSAAGTRIRGDEECPINETGGSTLAQPYGSQFCAHQGP